MINLISGELRRLHLGNSVYIIETDSGYVLTDGWLTDWLRCVNDPPIKFMHDGIFKLNQVHNDLIANFIDERF